MILVDLNQVMISNLMAQNKGNLSELPSKDAVRHSILNTIRALSSKTIGTSKSSGIRVL